MKAVVKDGITKGTPSKALLLDYLRLFEALEAAQAEAPARR